MTATQPASPVTRRDLPRTLARNPVVVIFVLAGVFEVLAGAAVLHGLALFAVAGALLGDAVRRRAGSAPAPGMRGPLDRGRVMAVVGVGLLYAVVVGGFGRFTWPITAAVVVPGVAAVAWAWNTSPRQPEAQPLDRWGVAAWVAVLVGLALYELATLFQQPSLTTSSYNHPTISVALDPVFATYGGRSVGLVLWLAFGWLLVER